VLYPWTELPPKAELDALTRCGPLVKEVNVPKLVIFVCAAVDKVPARVVAVRVPVTVAPPEAVASLAALLW